MRINNETFDARSFVKSGLDWADKKHDICLVTQGQEGGTAFESSVIQHEPSAVRDWVMGLKKRLGENARVAVALEMQRGPIVSALMEYDDTFVIFPLRPDALARCRRTFAPSRARDDPTDARLAADFLMRHPENFSPLRQ